MNGLLQNWCVNALAETLVSAGAPASPIKANRTTDPVTVAEGIVEAAAYLRFAEVHDIAHHRLIPLEPIHSPELLSRTAVLSQSCPLIETDRPEILGAIHELFITQRGRIPPGQGSRSRKSQGIFYTPQSVMDYIVNLTVDCRLDNRTPDEVANITILDPAVGCGGFLLTAFRKLMAWRLNWYIQHDPTSRPDDVIQAGDGWRLTLQCCHSILRNSLYGADLDAGAIEVARRILWLELLMQSAGDPSPDWVQANSQVLLNNLRSGHALTGPAFGQPDFTIPGQTAVPIHWSGQFPHVALRGGFDVILGNPPYRRERGYKREMDEIARTPLGRFRSPRMDLWYYFVHRGIELLGDQGSLSFITNAYWMRGTGAEKLLKSLSSDVHLDELLLLDDLPLFRGVSGRHTIFCITKTGNDSPPRIKIARDHQQSVDQVLHVDDAPDPLRSRLPVSLRQMSRVDHSPPGDALMRKLQIHSPLHTFGVVRQGIAENPATINHRTQERFADAATAQHWRLNEGVFSLHDDEVGHLDLPETERKLLRPYHDLQSISRYWAQPEPPRWLIYSTRHTCPSIEDFPKIRDHLTRFRAILDSRRETRNGSNQWWHLHWPRDEKLWIAPKLIVPQMSVRPSVVPARTPMYVSFSANVFVPAEPTGESLDYICGLLNSRVLWAWFELHAKHRGIGLDINCHVLEQAPIRRIDFEDPVDCQLHLEISSLVQRRLKLANQQFEAGAVNGEINQIEAQTQSVESQIEELVINLYGLDKRDVDQVHRITSKS